MSDGERASEPMIKPLKSMNELSTEDILNVREAMDKTSLTLFDPTFTPYGEGRLRIDQFNAFLIESFNYFSTEGLVGVFENKELVIQDAGQDQVIIRFRNPRLTPPTKDGPGGRSTPLWPHEARERKIDYSGSLFVSVEIEWVGSTRSGKELLGEIHFGKIPVMVGSQWCNLSNSHLISSEKDLIAVKEHANEFMGYFVIAGNNRNLISQNYLKRDFEMVISSKLGTTTELKSACMMRSSAPDGTMTAHRVFIMSSSSNNLSHSSQRIYVKIGDWMDKNIYDKNVNIGGVNIVSIFRLAVILLYRYNPFMESDRYTIGTTFQNKDPETEKIVEQRIPGGVFNGQTYQSTYELAYQLFLSNMRDYCDDKLYSLAAGYITDTINEASIEKDETDFWTRTVTVDKGGKDLGTILEKAHSLLDTFGKTFLAHIGDMPFSAHKRKLLDFRYAIFEQIKKMHSAKGLSNDSREIYATLSYLDGYSNLILEGKLEEAKVYRAQLKAQRGIEPTQEYMDAQRSYTEFKNVISAKMKMISYMAVKILRVELELTTLDDRDNLGNQMYEDAGILMTSRFASMLKQVEGTKSFQMTRDANSIKAELIKLGQTIITAEFSSNFSTGEWNKRGVDKKRTGVTDLMPASVTVAQISYLRRMSAQSKGHSKNTAARDLTGLQIGYICPAETPEGQQCGNVEHLAFAATITNNSYDRRTMAYSLIQMKSRNKESPANVFRAMSKAIGEETVSGSEKPIEPGEVISKNAVRREIEDIFRRKLGGTDRDPFISENRRKGRETPLFLNGVPYGWVDGITFRNILISKRRQGEIHPHTGIHYSQRISETGIITQLKIETTGGRIVQPLLICEDPQETINKLWEVYLAAKSGQSMTISELFATGMVEYVDPAELEFLDLAPSVSEYLRSVRDGKPKRYDHIMLNPAFMLGVAANIMPFANMNAFVRNSYFTQMVKQPIDAPNPTYLERPHTAVGKLHSPQIPLIKTAIYDHLFRQDYWGQNLKILIAPTKTNEEDGIVVSEHFVKSGSLSSIKYSAFPFHVLSDQELEFERKKTTINAEGVPITVEDPVLVDDPDRYGRGIIRVDREVVRPNPDGSGPPIITREPVIVKPKEILASKTRPAGNDQKEVENLFHDSLRDGVVDRIMWSKNTDGSKMVYVIIKVPNTMWLGDKIASRFSQKGVIAAVFKDSDMPYDAETGEIADIIINPQAFPSRMTPGMLAEMLVANAHIYPDKRKIVPILFEEGLDIQVPMERLFIVNSSEFEKFKAIDFHVLDDASVRAFFNQLANDPLVPEGNTLLISSEDVTSQLMMDFLLNRDLVQTDPFWRGGLWAFKFYSQSPSQKETKEISSRKFMPIVLTENTKDYVSPNDSMFDRLKTISPEFTNNMCFGVQIPVRINQVIPGLFMDTAVDDNGQRMHPMRGVRLSEFPTVPVPSQDNIYTHLGNNAQDVYIKGNASTPVADQCIAAYMDRFFIRHNFRRMFFDFVIPDDMLGLNLIDEDEQSTTMYFQEGTTYGDLLANEEDVKIKAWVSKINPQTKEFVIDATGAPIQEEKIIEVKLFDAWERQYPDHLIVPKENLIDLPDDPRDIYIKRKETIKRLREATIFKEGADITDAMREMELMGYSPDMKARYIDPKTGREIEGALASGWSFYMPLKHKVKDKMYARGQGGKDNRTYQANAGRTKGGGVKFNYPDVTAVAKSGATSFIADRLMEAGGKTTTFVCKSCGKICEKMGPKSSKAGEIICRNCPSMDEAVRISIPYVTLLERTLLMGAGIDFNFVVGTDDFESDEP